MAVYMMMLYVTREQENAIHELFSQRTWPLLKSDPSSVLRGPQHVFTFGSLQDRTWEFHTVPATQLSGPSSLGTNDPLKGQHEFVMSFDKKKIEPAFNCKVLVEKLPPEALTGACSRKVKGAGTSIKQANKETAHIRGKTRQSSRLIIKLNQPSVTSLKKKEELKGFSQFNGSVSTGKKQIRLKSNKFTKHSAMPAEEGEENNIVNGEGVEVQGVSELNDNHGGKTSEDIRNSSNKLDEIANNIEDAEHDTEDMSSNIQDMEDNTEDMSDNIEHMDDNIEDNIEDIEDKKVDDKKKSDNSRKKKKINDDDYIPYKYTYPKPPKKPKTPRKDKESKPPKPKVRKKDPNKGRGRFPCQFCNKVYTFKRVFDGHFIKEGTSCMNVCTYCGKIYGPKFIKRHIFYRHERDLEIKIKCETCGRNFMGTHDLKQHMEIHSLKQHVCHICGAMFKNHLSSYSHMKRHEGEKLGLKHTCPICNKTFTCQYYLKSHISVTHNNEQYHICDICGSTLKSKASLKTHITCFHGNQRKYKCTVCGKSYKYSHQVSTHKKMYHDKVKRFHCKECGKSFYFDNQYKDHLNIHLGLKPHKCGYCPCVFATREQRTQHRRKHRGTHQIGASLNGGKSKMGSNSRFVLEMGNDSMHAQEMGNNSLDALEMGNNSRSALEMGNNSVSALEMGNNSRDASQNIEGDTADNFAQNYEPSDTECTIQDVGSYVSFQDPQYEAVLALNSQVSPKVQVEFLYPEKGAKSP
ncbi:GDNF-inducible zinc finger protein 1-like [Mya arenaria]|uniref:GDNF-inducible zinc finger protein 1-like n=1 Tax=Mya arenaria TaxID=6604 RepID=UPI0022E5E578|nr:GDNF-inducible zinc finger protein 1-like [Mya arenaria]XP_052772829.1 GDNF-inducible zinc finger protein 1-like [Mya arenaria]